MQRGRGRGCILAVAVLLFLNQHSAETLRQAQAKAKEKFFWGGDGGELELEAIFQLLHLDGTVQVWVCVVSTLRVL